MMSAAGLIGGLVGLAVGLLDYWVVSKIVLGKWNERRRTGETTGIPDTRTQEIIRLAVFAATVVGFPVVGYLTGRAIAGA